MIRRIYEIMTLRRRKERLERECDELEDFLDTITDDISNELKTNPYNSQMLRNSYLFVIRGSRSRVVAVPAQSRKAAKAKLREMKPISAEIKTCIGEINELMGLE